jgi:hypothetical protein
MFKTKSMVAVIVGLSLLMLFMVQWSETTVGKASRQKMESVNSFIINQPANQVKWSMDRYLLNERNARFNDPNKMNYLYMVLCDGTWLKTTIIGKMTSTSKRLTPPEIYGILDGSSSVWYITSPRRHGYLGI